MATPSHDRGDSGGGYRRRVPDAGGAELGVAWEVVATLQSQG
jgi:hypothetical protein